MSLPTDLAQMARDGGIETRKLADNAFSTDKLFQIQQGEFIGRDNLQTGTGNVDATQTYPDISLTSALSAPFNATTAWRSLSAYLNQVINTNTNNGILSGNQLQLELYETISGGAQFLYPSLAPNGKIYYVPYGTVNIAVAINPETNTINTVGAGQFPVTAGSFVISVLAPNNKIYCFPQGGTIVTKIDPSNDTATQIISYTGHTGGIIKYAGGLLGSDGKIYNFPLPRWRENSLVKVIDPSNDTVTNFASLSFVTGLSSAGHAAVLAGNGNIYMCPGSESNKGYYITPNATNFTTYTPSITFPGLFAGTNPWGSGSLGPNGKIYFFPSTTVTTVLVIDPTANAVPNIYTIGSVFTGVVQSAYQGSALAPNGKIYSFPSTITSIVLCVDPSNDTVTTFGVNLGTCAGAVVAPNGKIYVGPYQTTRFLSLPFLNNNNFDLNACLSPFLGNSN